MTLRLTIDSTGSVGGDPHSINIDRGSQTFTLSTGFDVTIVTIKTAVSAGVSSGGNMVVELYEAGDSGPGGNSTFIASGTKLVADIQSGGVFSTFLMSPNPSLAIGTTYAVVFYRDTTALATARAVDWRIATTDAFQQSGVAAGYWKSTDAGLNWTRGLSGSGSTVQDALLQLFGSGTTNPDEGAGPGKIADGTIVDWNGDGVFDSSEAIIVDIMSYSWNRGSNPEEGNTPGGSLTITISDPDGDYIPLSTGSRFGSGNVDTDKGVIAKVAYGGTTFPIFRGLVNRITPRHANGVGSAVLYCVDETDLFKHTISHLDNGNPTTSGNVTSSGDRPTQGLIAGSTSGVISRVLNESSFSSTRRDLSEGGSTFENFWFYKESGKKILDEIEDHEQGRIYINNIGDVVFHSSTHREGSTALFSFSSTQFTDLEYTLDNLNIRNRAIVTVHDRQLSCAAVLGSLESTSLPTIVNGSDLTFTIEFDSPPSANVVTPAIAIGSTRGLSAVGVGSGTSFAGSDVTIQGKVIGVSSIRLTVANNSGETIRLGGPEGDTGSGSTTNPIQVTGTILTDRPQASTASVVASINQHGLRSVTRDFRWFSGQGKASIKATNLATDKSTSRPAGVRLHLVGSDSDLITQILTRDIDDRIEVTSSHFGLSSTPFYITQQEGEIIFGGHLTAVWTLEQAT